MLEPTPTPACRWERYTARGARLHPRFHLRAMSRATGARSVLGEGYCREVTDELSTGRIETGIWLQQPEVSP
jgi:hypothetical protein